MGDINKWGKCSLTFPNLLPDSTLDELVSAFQEGLSHSSTGWGSSVLDGQNLFLLDMDWISLSGLSVECVQIQVGDRRIWVERTEPLEQVQDLVRICAHKTFQDLAT